MTVCAVDVQYLCMWGTWQVLTHYALRRGLGFSPAGETSPIDPALDAAISFGSHEWNWMLAAFAFGPEPRRL